MYGKDGEILGYVEDNAYQMQKPKSDPLLEAFEDLQEDGTIKPVGVALKEDIWNLKAKQLEDIVKPMGVPSELLDGAGNLFGTEHTRQFTLKPEHIGYTPLDKKILASETWNEAGVVHPAQVEIPKDIVDLKEFTSALAEALDAFKNASFSAKQFNAALPPKRYNGHHYYRKLSRKERKNYRQEQAWQALYVPLTAQLSERYDDMSDFLSQSFIWHLSHQGHEYWEMIAGYMRDECNNLVKLYGHGY